MYIAAAGLAPGTESLYAPSGPGPRRGGRVSRRLPTPTRDRGDVRGRSCRHHSFYILDLVHIQCKIGVATSTTLSDSAALVQASVVRAAASTVRRGRRACTEHGQRSCARRDRSPRVTPDQWSPRTIHCRQKHLSAGPGGSVRPRRRISSSDLPPAPSSLVGDLASLSLLISRPARRRASLRRASRGRSSRHEAAADGLSKIGK